MAKVENPYSKVLGNVEDALALHKIEYSRMMRNFLEIQLEQKVHTLENHPLVKEIKSQDILSEEDQILLDTNAFSLNYHKDKLLTYKNFEKDYKKFVDVATQLKGMIKEAENKLSLNAIILSKFTEDEVKKDPKLKKMVSYVPNGYDIALSKFTELDLSLSVGYSNYISKNNEDLAEKLTSFLEESKTFRLNLIRMLKQPNEEQKVEEKEETHSVVETSNETLLFGDNRDEFESLKKSLLSADVVSEQELNDAKFYLSLAMSGEQLAAYNKFEEELISLYQKNASLISKNADSYTDWMGVVNKILSSVIFEMIDNKEKGENPVDVIDVYTKKYIPEEKNEESSDGGVKNTPKPKTTDRKSGKGTSFVKRIIQ